MSIHSIRRINFLGSLNSASKYLEIGVSKGHTFNQLRFPLKHAVDPLFRFNVGDFQEEGVTFFQQTSDSYFMAKDQAIKFDIIFLNGLPTYDQTYRDFTHAISHASESTIFIVDDSIPSDSYSAMRNQQFAVKTRGQESPLSGAKGKDAAWHGDVYKMLFFLKLFHPQYDYATICEDNPQTIIWNRAMIPIGLPEEYNAMPFKQFNDMRFLRMAIEALGKIDYFWTMNECADIFQVATEKALFNYLKENFSRPKIST
jgi:hypothetical protein